MMLFLGLQTAAIVAQEVTEGKGNVAKALTDNNGNIFMSGSFYGTVDF